MRSTGPNTYRITKVDGIDPDPELAVGAGPRPAWDLIWVDGELSFDTLVHIDGVATYLMPDKMHWEDRTLQQLRDQGPTTKLTGPEAGPVTPVVDPAVSEACAEDRPGGPTPD